MVCDREHLHPGGFIRIIRGQADRVARARSCLHLAGLLGQCAFDRLRGLKYKNRSQRAQSDLADSDIFMARKI